MSKENLEHFMKQVADSEDLLSRIGDEIAGDDLVALGSEHGWEFSIENLQAAAELSDAELEEVSGGGTNVNKSRPKFRRNKKTRYHSIRDTDGKILA